jgi:hypothetical protein
LEFILSSLKNLTSKEANMTKHQQHGEDQRKKVKEFYDTTGGNISEIARQMKLARATVLKHLRKLGISKPMAGGSLRGIKRRKTELPAPGTVKRYILSSVQNNTYVHDGHWENIQGLAEHYDAQIMLGTFTYNQNSFGPLAVKRGKKKPYEKELWYDPKVEDYIVDHQVQLGNSLVWCGEMNILPTAVNPIAGLETYAHRKSAIFPHAKVAMRSIATMMEEWPKFIYTTGAVTLKNYIQKKEGLKAETHHSYSALLVEVNDRGNWFARQLHTDEKGVMYDLNLRIHKGAVTAGHRPEAITWGDLHATWADEKVLETSMVILDTLKPRHQFVHDVLEGPKINHHCARDQHEGFRTWIRGLHRVEEEFRQSNQVLHRFLRPWVKTVVVDSNHDDVWIQKWLRDYSEKFDHANAEYYLAAQAHMYAELRAGKLPRDINMLEWSLKKVHQGKYPAIKFLSSDESYLICKDRIENGMHGHLGPGGARGTPMNLSEVGRRANTAHTHSAGIYNGLFVAGTSARKRWDYNRGPSAQNHSHILTYPNGARTIITLYEDLWKAA